MTNQQRGVWPNLDEPVSQQQIQSKFSEYRLKNLVYPILNFHCQLKSATTEGLKPRSRLRAHTSSPALNCVYKKKKKQSGLPTSTATKSGVIFTGRWCRSVLLGCGWQSTKARSRPIHTTPSSHCCNARISLWRRRPGLMKWVAIKRDRGEGVYGLFLNVKKSQGTWISSDWITHLEGEEDGEPGEHSWWMCFWFYTWQKQMHTIWVFIF